MRHLGCTDILPAAGPDELNIRLYCETPTGSRSHGTNREVPVFQAPMNGIKISHELQGIQCGA